MTNDFLRSLYEITEEEKSILEGKQVEKNLYTSDLSFNIQGKKLLQDMPLIIRTHTRFADFPLHSHDYLEMMYVVDGRIVHILGHERIELNKGDLLIMNKYCIHSINRCELDDIGVNFILSDSFLSSIMEKIQKEERLFRLLESNLSRKSEAQYMLFHTKGNIPIENIINSVMYSLYEKKTDYPILTDSISLLFSYLIFYKNEISDETDDSLKESKEKRMIVNYIRSHLKDANLTELSDMFGLSNEYLSRKVKSLFNKGFKDLLIDERLLQSSKLLKDSKLQVNEIISQVGYENKSYFYKEFKERYGMTPHKWRNS